MAWATLPWLGVDLPDVGDVPLLRDDLVALGAQQVARDRLVRAEIQGVTAWRAYQQRVRDAFWRAVGGQPERTDLHVQTVGTIARPGYRIEKVRFESRPGLLVPALVYVPDQPERFVPPHPLVLRPLGHYPAGKGTYLFAGRTSDVQPHCIHLARKGCVAVTFDPFGQGERGDYHDRRSGNNHFTQGWQAFLVGQHLGQHYVWDCMRALDYALTRPDVDPGRVCVTGTSGGGAQTLYHAAVDERVTLAVPACAMVQSEVQIEQRGLHAESIFPGYLEPYGPNNTALGACIAPRPLLLIAARHDPAFPWRSTRAVYEELRGVYAAFGAEDRLALVVTESFHGYTLPMRLALYRWLHHWWRWPGQEEGEPADPRALPEWPQQLWCTPSGDVRGEGSTTLHALIRARADELRVKRAAQRAANKLGVDTARLQEGIRASLLLARGTVETKPIACPRHVAETAATRTEWLELRTEPDCHVQVSLTFARDAGSASQPQPAVIWLDEQGGGTVADVLPMLCARGVAVATPALRLGHALLSLTFGRTELGTATADVLAIIRYIRERTEIDGSRLAVVGRGRKAALVALYVALLDPQVAAVVSAGPPFSLEALLDKPESMDDLMLQPGALQHFDVSDLLAGMASRPLLLCPDEPTADGLATVYGRLRQDERFVVRPLTFMESAPDVAGWLTTVLARNDRLASGLCT